MEVDPSAGKSAFSLLSGAAFQASAPTVYHPKSSAGRVVAWSVGGAAPRRESPHRNACESAAPGSKDFMGNSASKLMPVQNSGFLHGII